MSIPLEYLEPGGVYSGPNEQHREIIAIDGDMITYRIVRESVHGQSMGKTLGVVATVRARTFKDWVYKEVA